MNNKSKHLSQRLVEQIVEEIFVLKYLWTPLPERKTEDEIASDLYSLRRKLPSWKQRLVK